MRESFKNIDMTGFVGVPKIALKLNFLAKVETHKFPPLRET